MKHQDSHSDSKSHAEEYTALVRRTASGRVVRTFSFPANMRLLDRLRLAIRARHLSPRTEEAYVSWVRRFILFHDKRHPLDLPAAEAVKSFLQQSSVCVSASAMRQAHSALVFFYAQVLHHELPWIDGQNAQGSTLYHGSAAALHPASAHRAACTPSTGWPQSAAMRYRL